MFHLCDLWFRKASAAGSLAITRIKSHQQFTFYLNNLSVCTETWQVAPTPLPTSSVPEKWLLHQPAAQPAASWSCTASSHNHATISSIFNVSNGVLSVSPWNPGWAESMLGDIKRQQQKLSSHSDDADGWRRLWRCWDESAALFVVHFCNLSICS